jgi:hypothetical protein
MGSQLIVTIRYLQSSFIEEQGQKVFQIKYNNTMIKTL